MLVGSRQRRKKTCAAAWFTPSERTACRPLKPPGRLAFVASWTARVESEGVKVLAARKRGPKPRPRLDAAIERDVVRAIRNRCPDQLLLPFALWTRQAVAALILRRTGRGISVWTAGRYLKRWNMTPQKPMR